MHCEKYWFIFIIKFITEMFLSESLLPSSVSETVTQLSHPRGLTISREGHLIVTEWDHSCITTINTTSGAVIDRFGQYGSGKVEFHYPNGISMAQNGHIIIADFDNHRLQVLTVEGAFVAAVGSKGSQPLQFDRPCDVAVHHNDGKIFVTERKNNRVQVLNPDLSYSHWFGIVKEKNQEN